LLGELAGAGKTVLVDAHERPGRPRAELDAGARGQSLAELLTLLRGGRATEGSLDLGERVGRSRRGQAVIETGAGRGGFSQRPLLQHPAERESEHRHAGGGDEHRAERLHVRLFVGRLDPGRQPRKLRAGEPSTR
jgi:hypothetical protein